MGEWLFFTFALTGRRNGEYGTQGVALGYELAGLSARAGPLTIGLWTLLGYSPRGAAGYRDVDFLGAFSRRQKKTAGRREASSR